MQHDCDFYNTYVLALQILNGYLTIDELDYEERILVDRVLEELEEEEIIGIRRTYRHFCKHCPSISFCDVGEYIYEIEEASDDEIELYHEIAKEAYTTAWDVYCDEDYDNQKVEWKF